MVAAAGRARYGAGSVALGEVGVVRSEIVWNPIRTIAMEDEDGVSEVSDSYLY